MKLTFKFENGNSQLVLTPQNSRDKICLDLCLNERPEITLKPTNEDCIILEFGERNYKTSVEEPISLAG